MIGTLTNEIRRAEVFISFDVKQLLVAIGKSRNIPADQVADSLLREIIYANYPQARELMLKMQDLREELVNSFREGNETTATD